MLNVKNTTTAQLAKNKSSGKEIEISAEWRKKKEQSLNYYSVRA